MKALYQWTIERQVAELEKLRDEQLQAKKAKKSNKGGKNKTRPRDSLFGPDGERIVQRTPGEMKPMFIIAHELFDALPIH